MITTNNLTKKFGKLYALDRVQLSLDSARSYALIGPNGSGKTTLIKCILGLVLADSGEIFINGQNIAGKWKYRNQIGYMPQTGKFPENITIRQLFSMVKNIRKEDKNYDEELIDKFGLKSIYEKRLHTLSGGTRQKVSAAIAFLFNPSILILDEPTAGLDPVSTEHLKDKIQKEKDSGKLIIITSHIMSDLDDLATDVVYLFEGKLLYRNSVVNLKQETGFNRLGKAISHVITEYNHQLTTKN